jgi:hypothetical protein
VREWRLKYGVAVAGWWVGCEVRNRLSVLDSARRPARCTFPDGVSRGPGWALRRFALRSGRRRPPNPKGRRRVWALAEREGAEASRVGRWRLFELGGRAGEVHRGLHPELVGRRSRPAVPRLPLAALGGGALKRRLRPAPASFGIGYGRLARVTFVPCDARRPAALRPKSPLEGSLAAHLATPRAFASLLATRLEVGERRFLRDLPASGLRAGQPSSSRCVKREARPPRPVALSSPVHWRSPGLLSVPQGAAAGGVPGGCLSFGAFTGLGSCRGSTSASACRSKRPSWSASRGPGSLAY